MNPNAQKTRRTAGMVVSFVALMGLSAATVPPVRHIPDTAHRFFCYMSAIEKTGQRLSFWDKVTYSLVLAGTRESGQW